MRKKLMSLLLAAAMTASLLPGLSSPVLAEEENDVIEAAEEETPAEEEALTEEGTQTEKEIPEEETPEEEEITVGEESSDEQKEDTEIFTEEAGDTEISTAEDEETQSFAFGTEATELAPGSYEVAVGLKKAADHTQDSGAAGCFASTGTLEVSEDGSASLTVGVSSVTFGTFTSYATDYQVFQSDGTTAGDTVAATVNQTVIDNGNEYPSEITFAIPDNSWDGVYMSMYVEIMENVQNAWLFIDYAGISELNSEKHYTATERVEEFGEYNVNVDVTALRGMITGVSISGDDFSGTYAENNQFYLDKAIAGMQNLWNGKSITDAEDIYKVDTVSGATYSSRAIRDAVMSALELSYEEEIQVPESVESGIYEVPVTYYSETAYHVLNGSERSKSVLRVGEDGTMTLELKLTESSDAGSLFLTGINGYYENNDKSGQLTSENMTVTEKTSPYADEYLPEGSKVATALILPLTGGLAAEYATNVSLYVPAMNNLDGEISGIVFDHGRFRIDASAKIYWDDMERIGDMPKKGSLTFAQSSVSKTYGDKTFRNTLKATTNSGVTYKSSNTSVAKVSSKGTITITGVGTAKITASADATEQYTAASASYTLKVLPGKAAIGKIANVSGKAIRMHWSKGTAVGKAYSKTAYYIQYSTSSKFTAKTTKTLKVKGTVTVATLKKLTKGKTYYIRMRAYNSVVKKYGKYSTVKKVKVKK